MSDLNYNVDDEISKYIDAYQIQKSGIGPRNLKFAPRRFNPITGKYDVLSRMQNGGYLKIGSEPLAMSEAPKQPSIVSQETIKMPDIGPQVESAMEYADTVKRKAGQVTADDMLAAGYDANTIKAIGIGADVEPMVLSTQEIEDRLRSGGSFLEYDPTIRETGRVELTQYLIELAEGSLAEDLRAQGIRALNPEADTDATLTEDQIATLIEGERPRLENEARSLSGMFFGDETTFGIGVGDFVTAGVMDIQEGARLFKQGLNNDSVADRSFGALLVLAGIAEATGVGMLVGKAIKKSIPKLRAGLADVSERLNQPGEMPTVGSNFGNVGGVAKVEAPTENKPGIIAFHGSGTDFNEFKLEKIGTGEGNQAYGYGLYFTDVKDIAEYYRAILDFNNNMKGKRIKYKGEIFEDLGDTPAAEAAPPSYMAITNIAEEMNAYLPANPKLATAAAAKERLLKRIDAEIEKNKNLNAVNNKRERTELRDGQTLEELLIKEAEIRKQALLDINPDDIEIERGKVFEVNLGVNTNDLVDYDKSLNEQSLKIKKALQPFYAKYGVANSADFGTLLESVKSSRSIPEDEFSEQLAAQGIQGVKYKAAGSRGADSDVADVKMNYVIFDDKLIDIIKKYGIVPPVAVTAMGAKKDEKET